MEVRYNSNLCQIYISHSDSLWYSPSSLNFLASVKSCLLSLAHQRSYNDEKSKRIVFIQTEDIIDPPMLCDYREIDRYSSNQLTIFLSEYIHVLQLLERCVTPCFFISSYNLVGFYWLLAAMCHNRFWSLNKLVGCFFSPSLFSLLKSNHKIFVKNKNQPFFMSDDLYESKLAEKSLTDSSSLSLSSINEMTQSVRTKSQIYKLKRKKEYDLQQEMTSLYHNNFILLDFVSRQKVKTNIKIDEVYIDLNYKMLPFRGLLKLLFEGLDLFFVSSNKQSFEVRLEAFSSYMEKNIGTQKASFLCREKIFYFNTNEISPNKLVLTRKDKYTLVISQGLTRESFYLVPQPIVKQKESLRTEIVGKEGLKCSFKEVAQVFFDSILRLNAKDSGDSFLGLMLQKLVLIELDKISHYCKNELVNIVNSLKSQGLLLSFSNHYHKDINEAVSNEVIKDWLFDNFLISLDLHSKIQTRQSEFLNEELISLRFKVILAIIMILLVKRCYFSSYVASEYYLRQLFFIEANIESFQCFLAEVGEEKFEYLVWQFFPEYLGSLSYFKG